MTEMLQSLNKMSINNISIGSYVMLHSKEELIEEYGYNKDNNINTPIIPVSKEMEEYLGKILIVKSILTKYDKDNKENYHLYKFKQSGDLLFTKNMIKIGYNKL